MSEIPLSAPARAWRPVLTRFESQIALQELEWLTMRHSTVWGGNDWRIWETRNPRFRREVYKSGKLSQLSLLSCPAVKQTSMEETLGQKKSPICYIGRREAIRANLWQQPTKHQPKNANWAQSYLYLPLHGFAPNRQRIAPNFVPSCFCFPNFYGKDNTLTRLHFYCFCIEVVTRTHQPPKLCLLLFEVPLEPACADNRRLTYRENPTGLTKKAVGSMDHVSARLQKEGDTLGRYKDNFTASRRSLGDVRDDVKYVNLGRISAECSSSFSFVPPSAGILGKKQMQRVSQTECKLWSTLPPNPPNATTASCGCVADTFTPRQLSSTLWFSVKSGGSNGEYCDM